MNKKKAVLLTAVSVGALLAVRGITLSYLMDYEKKENVITIGKIGLNLDENPSPENPYTDEQTAVTGTIIGKSPKLTNTGNVDEYVFLKVEVPEHKVTFLYESGENEGQKIDDEPKFHQIFRIKADEPNTASITDNITDSKDVQFTYHVGKENADGWVLIDSTDDADGKDDVYIFAYNTKLAPNAATVSLFDSIQLRSFIETQATGERKVNVTAYGIQTKNLDIEGLDTLRLGNKKLSEIYEIVERKAEQNEKTE